MYEVIAKIEGYGFTFDAETGFKKSEADESSRTAGKTFNLITAEDTQYFCNIWRIHRKT